MPNNHQINFNQLLPLIIMVTQPIRFGLGFFPFSHRWQFLFLSLRVFFAPIVSVHVFSNWSSFSLALSKTLCIFPLYYYFLRFLLSIWLYFEVFICRIQAKITKTATFKIRAIWLAEFLYQHRPNQTNQPTDDNRILILFDCCCWCCYWNAISTANIDFLFFAMIHAQSLRE